MSELFHGHHIRFEPGEEGATPLLLLHGTGGDENDLIQFGQIVAPRAPLLGVRGNQLEGTITRWFKRHGEGRFDLADLETQAAELADFIAAASARFGFARAPLAVGYSNGANITAGLLMRKPSVLSGAVLMRAMSGLEPSPGLTATDLPVLFLNGRYDPLAPKDRQNLLARTLREMGADVTEQDTSPGHELTMADPAAARRWWQALGVSA